MGISLVNVAINTQIWLVTYEWLFTLYYGKMDCQEKSDRSCWLSLYKCEQLSGLLQLGQIEQRNNSIKAQLSEPESLWGLLIEHRWGLL